MRRLIFVLIALATFNSYVALGLISRSLWAQNHIWFVGFLTVLGMLLELAGPLGDRLFFPALLRRWPNLKTRHVVFSIIDWASYLTLGLLSCLLLYMVFADLIALFWNLITIPPDTNVFDHRTLFFIIMATFTTMALGLVQARSGPVLKRIDISLKNLPPSFDGFTIAQISDLHIGPLIGHDYAANVVATVNGLKPDMIALTGDFVDGTVANLKQELAPLANLDAPFGKFFITGNHEYYWGPEAWIAEFKRLGLRVLLNEHEIIRKDDSEIILAGVTDYAMSDSDPEKALQAAPTGLVKILLAHQPASYKAAHKAGFDLQLSGHTHGGQYFPFNLVVKIFQRYVKGLYQYGAMQIYVSAGTGYWGPPLRTGVPAEITLITLTPYRP